MSEEVKIKNETFIVGQTNAEFQYDLFEILTRYGVAGFVSGLVKTDPKNADEIKAVYAMTIAAMLQNMPKEDKDFCINGALSKTSLFGAEDTITKTHFSGRIADYFLLGVQAIKIQLGDFSSFLSAIQSFNADGQEPKAQ